MIMRWLRGCFKAILAAGTTTLVAMLVVGGVAPAWGTPVATHHHRHTLAPGCRHVLWTAGDANRPGVFCGGLRQPPPGMEWNLVFDGTTSFTIHKGTQVQAFLFTPATPLARPWCADDAGRTVVYPAFHTGC